MYDSNDSAFHDFMSGRECAIQEQRAARRITFDVSPRFWAITPAFNINACGPLTLEFEWLCFAIYWEVPKFNNPFKRKK